MLRRSQADDRSADRVALLAAVAAALLAAPLACRRSQGDATSSGADAAAAALGDAAAAAEGTSAAAPELAPSPVAPTYVSRTAISYVEALRGPVGERELGANVEAVKKHFGGALPPGLTGQTAGLGTNGVRVTLLEAPDKTPFVVAVDERGRLLWSKERPAAGILPPVGRLAIAPGARGRIALVACDPPTSAVAVRLWGEEGTPFADFEALEVDQCDDVSALYWPRHGWLLVAAMPGATRAQLLTDDGRLAWGRRGVAVGGSWRAPSPGALALDTRDSFLFVQYAGSSPLGDRALAFRYDATGSSLWKTPTDLGEVPRVPSGQERPRLARVRDGLVRATLVQNRTVEVPSEQKPF